MNPGKVVDPYPIDANLRLGASYGPPKPQTHFQLPDDGGSFAHAALRCVGVGKCRGRHERHDVPELHGHARGEAHDARPRAHRSSRCSRATRSRDGWRSEAVQEALDLCLACKGCKGDCPVNVDMATYKAEFLSHYYKGRLRPRARLRDGPDHGPGAARLAHARGSPTPSRMCRSSRSLASGWRASHRARACRASRTRRSIAWFARAAPPQPGRHPGGPVRPTPSTTTSTRSRQGGRRGSRGGGLSRRGADRALCCGRPLYDYGMLDAAERFWQRNLAVLAP